jgi:hypothetical protein
MRLKLEKPLSFNPRAYAFSKPGKAKAAGRRNRAPAAFKATQLQAKNLLCGLQIFVDPPQFAKVF